MLAAIIEEERLRAALAFIITRAQPNRVYIAPIILLLRMYDGITINFGGRRLQNLCLHPFREAQHVDCPVHADLGGLHRVKLIMDRRGGTGEIVTLVYLNIERETNIMTRYLEHGVRQQMLHVMSRSRVAIIDAQNFVAALKQSFAQM
jgi:hypothetical protein